MKGEGYVVLTLIFRKVNRRWAAECKELGTATFGRSLIEAQERIKEAVLLHLNALEDVGERGRFFEEHKITFHRTKPRKEAEICAPISNEMFFQPYIQRLPALTLAH